MEKLKVFLNVGIIVVLIISIIALNNRLTNTEYSLNNKIANLKDRETSIIYIITKVMENQKIDYTDLNNRLKALEKKPVVRR